MNASRQIFLTVQIIKPNQITHQLPIQNHKKTQMIRINMNLIPCQKIVILQDLTTHIQATGIKNLRSNYLCQTRLRLNSKVEKIKEDSMDST